MSDKLPTELDRCSTRTAQPARVEEVQRRERMVGRRLCSARAVRGRSGTETTEGVPKSFHRASLGSPSGSERRRGG